MTPMAVTFENRRFVDDTNYPPLSPMHNHNPDTDRFPDDAPDVPSLNLSPFSHSAAMLGGGMMDEDVGSNVGFAAHSSPATTIATMHTVLPQDVSVPEDDLEIPSSIVAAAATAVAVANAAAMSTGSSDDVSLGPALGLISDTSGHAVTTRKKSVKKPGRNATKGPDGMYHCTWPMCDDEQQSFWRKCEFK